MTRPVDPDQIVRDFSAAWGRADLDYIMDAFAEDAVYHNMPMQPLEGKVAIRAGIEAFLKQSPGGIDFEIVNQVSAGSLVMNERVDTFENEGSKTAAAVAGFFEIDAEGKIKIWRDYFDMGAFQAS
ncbi:MAG: limonene-1,2-epoxide hydrolase [Deltaproteobacteria bacterium]|nr:limonene-1,2-epoxide hydrolase [Deltaproteobacteria bacterium]